MFSGCCEQELLSLVAEPGLYAREGFTSYRPWVQLAPGMGDLPRPGMELMPPALTGGFLTTRPPGKPEEAFLIT